MHHLCSHLALFFFVCGCTLRICWLPVYPPPISPFRGVCKIKTFSVRECRYITDMVLKRCVAIQNQKGIDLSWSESS